MRALRFSRPGPPVETLELVELPEPRPGPHELLVEVLASPISPMDRLTVRGFYPLPTRDRIPGAQGVGRVLVGCEGGPPIGSHVLLPIRCGAWRDRLCMPAEHAVTVPTTVDPASVCTLRVEALTASVCLDGLAPGSWFVHTPGGGSVGRYLGVLARHRELNSLALVGDLDESGALEADRVLPRDGALDLAALDLPRPTIGFDGSGGAATKAIASCLAAGGELVIYGAASRRPLSVPASELVFRDLRLRGFWLRRWAERVGPAEVAARLRALVELGVAQPPDAAFPLERWREAFRLAESKGFKGRVALRPSE